LNDPATAAAGPFSLPLIGDLPWIFKYGLHEYGLMCNRKYGNIFKVRQGLGWALARRVG
jgi:hypothetical protein